MREDVEPIAFFVHGALAALHLLGVVYHTRRQHWLHALIHGTAATYDIYSAGRHWERR